MSQLSDIRYYIETVNRPFTKRQIESELGIPFRSVKVILRQLFRENFIKKIGIDRQKTVYILNADKGLKIRKYRSRQKRFTLEHIQEAHYRGIKKKGLDVNDYLSEISYFLSEENKKEVIVKPVKKMGRPPKPKALKKKKPKKKNKRKFLAKGEKSP